MQQTESSQQLAPVRFEAVRIPLTPITPNTFAYFALVGVGTGLAVASAECESCIIVNASTGAVIDLNSETYPIDLAFTNIQAAKDFIRAVAAKVGWVESKGFRIQAYGETDDLIRLMTEAYSQVPESDRYNP